MKNQSMNKCELKWAHHSLQFLQLTKLDVAKLLNFLNRKGNPCATIYQSHGTIKQVVDKYMTIRLLNACRIKVFYK